VSRCFVVTDAATRAVVDVATGVTTPVAAGMSQNNDTTLNRPEELIKSGATSTITNNNVVSAVNTSPASMTVSAVDINMSTKLVGVDQRIDNPMAGLRRSYKALGDQHSKNASVNHSMFARALRRTFTHPNPRPLNFFMSNVFFSAFYQ